MWRLLNKIVLHLTNVINYVKPLYCLFYCYKSFSYNGYTHLVYNYNTRHNSRNISVYKSVYFLRPTTSPVTDSEIIDIDEA